MVNDISCLAFEDQLKLFKSRGMIFSDENKALTKFQSIGYYKLKEFAYSQATFIDGDPYNPSFENVRFDEILLRYYQDKNLRIFMLHAIEKIEVSVKTQFSFILGKKYGAFGYLNFSKWVDRKKYTSFKRIEKEQKFKKEILEKISKSSFIDLKNPNNLNNGFPSIWLLVDALTFGDIVYLIKLMSRSNVIELAKYYDCTYDEFISWLGCLNFVRNICAHNSNVLDIRFNTTPMLHGSWKKNLFKYEGGNKFTNRIAPVFFILHHFIDKINKNYKYDSLSNSLKKIIKNNPIKAQQIGFKYADSYLIAMPVKPRSKQRLKKHNYR